MGGERSGKGQQILFHAADLKGKNITRAKAQSSPSINKITNSNIEIRNSTQIQMIKIERMFQTGPFRIRCFGFSYNLRLYLASVCFGFRYSDFGF